MSAYVLKFCGLKTESERKQMEINEIETKETKRKEMDPN